MKTRNEYISMLRKMPKVNMGGCSGCIERNGFIKDLPVLYPFPIMIFNHNKSHVCSCSRKVDRW